MKNNTAASSSTVTCNPKATQLVIAGGPQASGWPPNPASASTQLEVLGAISRESTGSSASPIACHYNLRSRSTRQAVYGAARDRFPYPPQGKFYLVDSGYPLRPRYLSPYKGGRYHVLQFRTSEAPRGCKELFNYRHASLRSVIERLLGVVKQKWQILRGIPSYPLAKQSKINLACFALHNYAIMQRDVTMEQVVQAFGKEYVHTPPQGQDDTQDTLDNEAPTDMRALREYIADGLVGKV